MDTVCGYDLLKAQVMNILGRLFQTDPYNDALDVIYDKDHDISHTQWSVFSHLWPHLNGSRSV